MAIVLTRGSKPVDLLGFKSTLVAPEWRWFWAGKSTAVVPGFAPKKTVGFFGDPISKNGAQGSEIQAKVVSPLGIGYDRTGTAGDAYLRCEAGSGLATHYEFKGDVPWTVCAVFQVHNTAADDRSLVARLDDPTSGERHFLLRTDLQGAPSNIEVYQSDTVTTLRITGGNVIFLDVPYLVVVTCDGATNGLLYTFDLTNGRILDNAISGSFPATGAVAGTEYFAFLGHTASDEWSGTAWMLSFHDFEMQRSQIQQLAADVGGPLRMARPRVGKAPVVGTIPSLIMSPYQAI